MYDVMRFWLDRGVAGFRIDAGLPVSFEDPKPVRRSDFAGEELLWRIPNIEHKYTDKPCREGSRSFCGEMRPQSSTNIQVIPS